MRRFWPTGGLWRHRDFLKLWSAETVSQFGSQVGQLALPLVAILVLDASAFEVAALGPSSSFPFILFTLPAGVWVDRLPRRPILIVGDFARAALLAYDPGRLRRGRADARPALRRRLPRRDVPGLLRRRLPVVSALARRPRRDHRRELEARDQPLCGAGRRAGVRRHPRPARSRPRTPSSSTPSASSAPGLFILRIRKDEAAPEVATVDGREDEPVVRAQGRSAVRARQPESPRAGGMHGDVELLLERRVLDLPRVRGPRARAVAGVIGLVFSSGPPARSSPPSPRCASRAASASGRRRSPWPRSSGPAILLIAFAPAGNAAIPFLVAAQLVFGFSVVVYNIVQVSYRQAICPPRLQGRMNSVMRFMVWGTIPLGTLVGGALATLDRPAGDHRRRRRRGTSAVPLDRVLTPTPSPRDARADRRRPAAEPVAPKRYRHSMPELPEVEAWVRELDPLVSRSPIEKAGPAHIATLKTAVPPLSELDGRRFAGARRRGKNLLFPIEDADLVLRVHLMSAGRLRYLRAGEKRPKTPDVQAALHRRRRAHPDRGGKKKRAGVWLVTQPSWTTISCIWGLMHSASTPRRSASSSSASGDSFIRSSATSARSPASDAHTPTRSCCARGSPRSRRRRSSPTTRSSASQLRCTRISNARSTSASRGRATRPSVHRPRAVVDRVLLEVHAGDRRAALRARLAEPVVDRGRRPSRPFPARAARARASRSSCIAAARRSTSSSESSVDALNGESRARRRISFACARPMPAIARWSRRSGMELSPLAL